MWRELDNEPDRREPDRIGGLRTSQTLHAQSSHHPDHPTAVFARDLDLPRGPERERVHVRSGIYVLRGAEARVLAAVGAFRVIPDADFRDPELGASDLRHLQDRGLVQTHPYVMGAKRTRLLTLTTRGRDLLEDVRRESGRADDAQRFYAGIRNPRELAHDAFVYRAYVRETVRLERAGGRIRRVVLEEDLKREYQRFLQASNRRRRDSDGRPDRSVAAIAQWAHDHDLPVENGHVQFPDLRIEYEERDGRRALDDVEVTTPHYRGAHAAAKARSGFARYRATGTRVGGSRTGRSGGRGFDPRLAEEMLE